jgi:translation initiation factor IF-2
MADVTVKQLAADVGAPVDRLLKQIVEAGLKARSENDAVTSDEKQQLLTYLRKTHGEAQAEPNKITLKRKTTTTLKAGKAKTVNVEVRKRRTYIKRAELQPEPEPEVEAPKPEDVAEQPATETPVVDEAPKVAAEQQEKPAETNAPTEPAAAEPVQEEKSEPELETEPEDMPMPPPEDEGRDRKPKKKKEKVRERGDDIEEGKPKKKQAGHRGPRSRPVEEPLVISEDEEETGLKRNRKKSVMLSRGPQSQWLEKYRFRKPSPSVILPSAWLSKPLMSSKP